MKIASTILLLLLILQTPIGYCQEKRIKFPPDCNKSSDKLEFAYLSLEKLRQEYNEMGEKFRNKEITRAQWNQYVYIRYRPLEALLIDEKHKVLAEYRKSTKWEVNLEDLTEDINLNP